MMFGERSTLRFSQLFSFVYATPTPLLETVYRSPAIASRASSKTCLTRYVIWLLLLFLLFLLVLLVLSLVAGVAVAVAVADAIAVGAGVGDVSVVLPGPRLLDSSEACITIVSTIGGSRRRRPRERVRRSLARGAASKPSSVRYLHETICRYTYIYIHISISTIYLSIYLSFYLSIYIYMYLYRYVDS